MTAERPRAKASRAGLPPPTSAGGERARHRSLYREIPSMRCLDGCAACCGPAPVSPWEAERLGIPGAVVTPVHRGTSRCAFHVDGACSVYERRPFICRLYGTATVAPCERGQAPTTLIPTGRAIAMVERFEVGCPPSWQADRRAAVRAALTAAGDEEALASLDGHRAAIDRARAAVGALEAGQANAAAPGGDTADRTGSSDAGGPGTRSCPDASPWTGIALPAGREPR